MSTALTEMPAALVEFLQQPRIVVVVTIDHEHGGPITNVISWVLAKDPATIRLMGDGRSRLIQNIRANSQIVLTVLGAGSAWSIYGGARVIADPTPGVPLRLATVEVTGLNVWDAMFFGARLAQEPTWDVTYDKSKAQDLDAKVYGAMRSL